MIIMKTRFKDNRDRWPPIGMWKKVGEGGRRVYDHGRIVGLAHTYDVVLLAEDLPFVHRAVEVCWNSDSESNYTLESVLVSLLRARSPRTLPADSRIGNLSSLKVTTIN